MYIPHTKPLMETPRDKARFSSPSNHFCGKNSPLRLPFWFLEAQCGIKIITVDNFAFSVYLCCNNICSPQSYGYSVSQTDQEKTGKGRRKEKSPRLVFQDLFPLDSGKTNQKKKKKKQICRLILFIFVLQLQDFVLNQWLHFSQQTWWELLLLPSIVKSSNSEFVLLQYVCVCSCKPTQIPLGSKQYK